VAVVFPLFLFLHHCHLRPIIPAGTRQSPQPTSNSKSGTSNHKSFLFKALQHNKCIHLTHVTLVLSSNDYCNRYLLSKKKNPPAKKKNKKQKKLIESIGYDQTQGPDLGTSRVLCEKGRSNDMPSSPRNLDKVFFCFQSFGITG